MALCAALAVASAARAGETVVRYGLCPSELVFAKVEPDVRHPDELRLVVGLSPDAARELGAITESHLGGVLELDADGAILLRMPITTVIQGRDILSPRWKSRAAASAFARLLTDPSLSLPCGVLD